MFNINYDNNTLEFVEDSGSTTLYKFVDEQTLKNPTYTLYAYVDIINQTLYVKFGEAKSETIYQRNNQTGLKANRHTIMIWESNKRDKEIHAKLLARTQNARGYIRASKIQMNSTEAYEIQSIQGLTNLINDITEYAESSTQVIKNYRPDYPDVVAIATEILEYYKEGNSKFILDLCTRFGKTGTFCLLYKMLNQVEDIRIHILASYVGTVKTSYTEEINTIKNNEDCLFVDPDQFEDVASLVSTVKSWLKNPKHYVCYYVALTGNAITCFDRRTEPLLKLKQYAKSLIIEEADFGAACPEQVKKVTKLANAKTKYDIRLLAATTGTKAEKCESIFTPDVVVTRDYIIDVLNKRPNAVGLEWYCLNNSEMVKYFNYLQGEMENFSDIFTLDNGHLRGELWLRDFINFIFNKQLPVTSRESRKYRNHELLNDSATMIFTSGTKETQHAFKKLLESILPGYLIQVINSDETTNAEAEGKARQAIKDYGHKVIFIAKHMANRSFSVPEIKNVVLLTNSGFPDQKIARALTPWKVHPEMKAHIIDIRLNYNTSSNLDAYFAGLAINSLEDNATHTSIEAIINEIKATDKLAFFEYFTNDVDPIRKLTDIEMTRQMQSRDYRVQRALKVLTSGLSEVDLPAAEFSCTEQFNFNDLVSTNIKGDADYKQVTRPTTTSTAQRKKAIKNDVRINYLAYLFNHKEEFCSGLYKTQILKNEFENNMPVARKKALEVALGLDMKTMCQIAKVLIKNNIDIYI